MIRFLNIITKKKNLYRAKKNINSVGVNCYFGARGSIVGGKRIIVGNFFSVGDNYKLQVWENNKENDINYPELLIGDNVSTMSNLHISCCRRIEIGNGCLFGDNVFITDNMHGRSVISEADIPPIERKLYSKGPVIIGDNVWLGRNVCVMPNVKIGNNAIVAANSVVTKDVEDNSIVGGVPASLIRVM